MQAESDGFRSRHDEFLKKIRAEVEQMSYQDDLSGLFKVLLKDLQPDLTFLKASFELYMLKMKSKVLDHTESAMMHVNLSQSKTPKKQMLETFVS